MEEKWKPKEGQMYYTPNPLNFGLCGMAVWHNDKCDKKYFKLNLVCRTKKEAKEKTLKMLKVIEE